MKKLMIAAAIVCAAVAANAASFSWSNTSGSPTTKIYKDSTTVLSKDYTAYLLCTSDITQGNFLDGVRDAKNVGTYVASKAISGANGTTDSNSKIPAVTFNYGTAPNTYTFYFAIINGDNILISETASGAAKDLGTTQLAFTSSSTWSKVNNGDGDYTSPGWYSTSTEPPEPTPEPTSAMLMLLGVAGLALKRKQK